MLDYVLFDVYRIKDIFIKHEFWITLFINLISVFNLYKMLYNQGLIYLYNIKLRCEL